MGEATAVFKKGKGNHGGKGMRYSLQVQVNTKNSNTNNTIQNQKGQATFL